MNRHTDKRRSEVAASETLRLLSAFVVLLPVYLLQQQQQQQQTDQHSESLMRSESSCCPAAKNDPGIYYVSRTGKAVLGEAYDHFAVRQLELKPPFVVPLLTGTSSREMKESPTDGYDGDGRHNTQTHSRFLTLARSLAHTHGIILQSISWESSQFITNRESMEAAKVNPSNPIADWNTDSSLQSLRRRSDLSRATDWALRKATRRTAFTR